jgi:hypothetical protein
MVVSGCTWNKPTQSLAIDTVACYVALANDVTPLLDAALSQPESPPECDPTRAVSGGEHDDGRAPFASGNLRLPMPQGRPDDARADAASGDTAAMRPTPPGRGAATVVMPCAN